MNRGVPFILSLGPSQLRRNIGWGSPVLLAQIFLQDFSGGGLWESFHKFDGTGALEMSETRAAELDQLRFAQLGTRLHNHQSFGHLAPFFVGNGNNGSLIDVGMCPEGFLHLKRGNVFAPTDNDVFSAIDNKDVAVL